MLGGPANIFGGRATETSDHGFHGFFTDFTDNICVICVFNLCNLWLCETQQSLRGARLNSPAHPTVKGRDKSGPLEILREF